MRRILAASIPLVLLLTGCGANVQSNKSDSPSSSASAAATQDNNAKELASVTIEPGGTKKAPTVKFASPLAISAEAMKVVTQGSGEQLKDGQTIKVRSVGFDASTGKQQGENFTSAAGGSITLSASFKANYPMVYGTFMSAKVGSYIAYGTPPIAAQPSSSTSAGSAAQPSSLTVFFVESASDPAKLMSAEDTKALEAKGGLPKATFDSKGVPSISIPKAEAPKDLVVQVLTEGSGEVLKATDSISAHYSGWRWEDSKQFDSSFTRGEPSTFGLQNVIQGWTIGLTGQKVGSTVLLTIPSELGYGDDASSGKPTGPLVFVVKIEKKV